jgi:hypothetical protein
MRAAKEEKQKEDIPEATESAGPEQPSAMTLSDIDRQVRQAVDASIAEPVRIDSVEELAHRTWMAVPKVFKEQYPERSYKWLSINGLHSDLTSANGLWQLVNRSNHPNVPDSFFDLATGGVLYSGQNILAYTWLDNVVKLEKKTLADFDAGEKAMRAKFNQTYHGADGKAAVVMEEVGDQGKMTPGTKPVVMTTDSDYDYGSV